MGEISLLNELELKFIELDLKLSSRCSLVNQLHDDDVQKINQIFGKSNEDKITHIGGIRYSVIAQKTIF